MATKVVMEALSPTMEEGRLVEWKKQVGDAVAAGDVLAEVETDKAVMELVARAGGTLLKQVVPAGTTVPVSELVALIGDPAEAGSTDGGAREERGSGAEAGAAAARPAEKQATQPSPGRSRTESMPPAPPPSAADEGREAKAAPAVAAAPVPGPNGQVEGGRVKASPLA